MKIIVAIDSFKGCLTSVEANAAACQGLMMYHPDAEVLQVPVSDGGEGWTEAFHAAIGGELVEADVFDPLMRPIKAVYLKNDRLAVIEMAKACGLTLLKPHERNPLLATSYGTGQLIVDAVKQGCQHFIIGLGGSATSDAGKGMLEALSDAFSVPSTPGHFVAGDLWKSDVFQNLQFSIATDVNNPLCGPLGAAHVFGPQKGATLEMVEKLDERAKAFAQQSAQLFGFDYADEPGAGAAGGLGYAFMQYLHANRRLGIDLLLDTIHFDDLIKNAHCVITGEGASDAQTLMGKLPYGIMQRARQQNIPTALIAGKISDKEALLDAGFSQVACINPEGLPLAEAMQKEVAKRNIAHTMKFLL